MNSWLAKWMNNNISIYISAYQQIHTTNTHMTNKTTKAQNTRGAQAFQQRGLQDWRWLLLRNTVFLNPGHFLVLGRDEILRNSSAWLAVTRCCSATVCFIISISITIDNEVALVLCDDGTAVHYGRNYSSNYSSNWKRSVYKQQFW